MLRLVNILWVLCLLVACSSDHVVDARGELQIANGSIEFPNTWVGFPTEAHLIVNNTGRATLRLSIEISEPFSVTRTEVAISAGDGHKIPILFNPGVPGRHDHQMQVNLPGGEAKTVYLIASALPVPPCGGEPCVAATFDPVKGECIREVLSDGSACTSGNPCAVDEQCHIGKCLGKPKDCGEDDICTARVCEPSTGACIEIDKTSECPTPANRCQTATCNPVFGCGVKDVRDFTSCGPADCREASLCRSGKCEQLRPPDGTPCNASCGPGKCKDGECNRREGAVLGLAARYNVEEGTELVFDGITDFSGMVYWVECGPSGCELVSMTPQGFRRWSAPLPFFSVEQGGTVLVDRWVLLVGARMAQVVAHDGVDGELKWSIDLRDALEEAFACGATCELRNGRLTLVDEGSVLYTASIAEAGGEATRTFLSLLDVGADTPGWSKKLEGLFAGRGPIADEEGHLYFSVSNQGATSLVSLTADGEERWRKVLDAAAWPVAVSEGQLVLSDTRLVATEGGSDLPLGATAAREQRLSPLLGATGYFFFADPDGALLVQPWEPSTGQTTPAVQVLPAPQAGDPSPYFTSPLLTQARGALFSMSQWGAQGWSTELVEVRGDGREARRCEVPSQAIFSGTASLRSNTWIAPRAGGVEFYTMPPSVGEVSGMGWVGPGGGPEGGGRPR